MLNEIQENSYQALKESDYESAVGWHSIIDNKTKDYIEAVSNLILNFKNFEGIKSRYYECLADMVPIDAQPALLAECLLCAIYLFRSIYKIKKK